MKKMGKNIVVLGSQWGDEGKGKIVDWLAERFDAVVRFQGGHNAGHTVIVNGKSTVLRLLPSGILHSHVHCFIGNGVVVSPEALLSEIDGLLENGVDIDQRLHISGACPLVLPYHVALDAAREAVLNKPIGTTKRGIGPTYEDKVARRGLRLVDLVHEDVLKEKLARLAKLHNFQLTQYYQQKPIPFEQVFDQLMIARERLLPFMCDVRAALADLRLQNKTILFEGAQGALLDIDLGTYPFVTSSNTTAGAVATGAGFGPLYLDDVWGVTKGYVTRVGAGPFVTELFDETGAYIAKAGHEFGSVTGRARRCGWFDAVTMRSVVQSNSLSGLILAKLDVLDALESIKLCVAYQYQDQRFDLPPMDPVVFAKCKPIYEELPGWQCTTLGMTDKEQLPQAMLDYIQRIESLLGVPVVMLSTGPDRSHTIII